MGTNFTDKKLITIAVPSTCLEQTNQNHTSQSHWIKSPLHIVIAGVPQKTTVRPRCLPSIMNKQKIITCPSPS